MHSPTYSSSQLQEWFVAYSYLIDLYRHTSSSVLTTKTAYLTARDWQDTARNHHSDSSLLASMFELELALAIAATNRNEETVPANMLEVFSDEQWPQLLIEFQCTLSVYTSKWPTLALRQQIKAGQELSKDDVPAESTNSRSWLIFAADTETRIRQLENEETGLLLAFVNGNNVSVVSQQLQTANTMEQITEYIINWCQEDLIIDIGVPIPENASYLPATE